MTQVVPTRLVLSTVVVVLASLVSAHVHAQTGERPLRSFLNTQLGFELKYPASWHEAPTYMGNTQLRIEAPSGEADLLVIVNRDPSLSDLTPGEYVKQMEAATDQTLLAPFRGIGRNLRVVERRRVALSGQPAFLQVTRAEITANPSSLGEPIGLQIRSISTGRADKYFMLSLRCAPAGADQWLPALDTVVKSFRITTPSRSGR